MQRKQADPATSDKRLPHPFSLVRFVYNAAFWVCLPPFFGVFEYSTGFVAFTVVIAIRFGVNLHTNNMLDLTPAQFAMYPFRIP